MISVAICTRDRCRLLHGALRSLEGTEGIGETDWELLVVDNGSSDATPSVVSAFETSLPLRYLYEPQPGLSRARNRAVAEFKGEYLLWTDDDVRVEQTWLAAYEAAFRRWPEAVVFGGPIRPDFEGTPPTWLQAVLSEVSSAYAIRELSDRPCPLHLPDALPYGANFVVRGDVQRARLFDEDLGFTPDRPHLRGEEVALLRSIFADGHSGRWIPNAAVNHRIPRDRQTWRYLWRYYQGQGQERALNGFNREEHLFFGRPRWLWRQVVERPLRLVLAGLRGDERRVCREFKRSAIYWGMLLEGP